MDIFAGDRRCDKRYDVALELRYRLRMDEGIVQIGRGITRDLSSGGVLFATDEFLAPGTPLDLSIDWPVHMSDMGPLELKISGQVVRANSRGTVLQVTRYEFRARGPRSFQEIPEERKRLITVC